MNGFRNKDKKLTSKAWGWGLWVEYMAGPGG